jgi:hypothetical protein
MPTTAGSGLRQIPARNVPVRSNQRTESPHLRGSDGPSLRKLTCAVTAGRRAMAVTSDHHAARLAFKSASALIA